MELLELTTCLARADVRLQGLDGVLHLLDSLLDVSARYSIAQAAASGSLRLFDRVMDRVKKAGEDPWLLENWLAKAMKHVIANADLHMAQRVHYYHPGPLEVDSLDSALRSGRLDLVQWLVEHRYDRMCVSKPPARLVASRPFDCCIKMSFGGAAHPGQLEVCRWMVEHGYVTQVGHLVAKAAEAGDLDTVAFLVERSDQDSLSSAAVRFVLERGHFHVLRYLHERGWLSNDAPTDIILITSDIAGEHESSIAYLEDVLDVKVAVEDYPETLTSYAQEAWKNLTMWGKMLRAVADGHLEATQWSLARQNARWGSDFVYEVAGKSGHLPIVQWLCKNESSNWPSLTPDAIEAIARGAAYQGHVPILDWLYEAHLYKCERSTINNAVANGQLTVLQWIYERDGDAMMTEAIDCAAGAGQLAVVQWLHEHTSVGCTKNAMDNAALHGHLETVKWLHAHRTEGCTLAAMTRAAGADAGHLEVVIWLRKHRDLQWPKTAACSIGADIIQWLAANNVMEVSQFAIMDAAVKGRLHTLQVLCALARDGKLDVDVAGCAAGWGHLGVLQWLYEQNPSRFDVESVRQSPFRHPHVMKWLEETFDGV